MTDNFEETKGGTSRSRRELVHHFREARAGVPESGVLQANGGGRDPVWVGLQNVVGMK